MADAEDVDDQLAHAAAGDHTIALLRLHAVEHSDTSLPLVLHRSAFGRLAASA